MSRNNTGRSARTKLPLSPTKEVLLYLLVGGYIIAGISHPYLLAPAVLLAQMQKRGYSKDRIWHALWYAHRQGYIRRRRRGRTTRVGLTASGKRKAVHYQLEQLRRSRPKHWDGKWRIIMFDIPASERAKRDALRALIKRLGCLPLQKSVWLYPFDCAREVQLLKDFFKFSDEDVRVVATSDIGPDMKYRRAFEL